MSLSLVYDLNWAHCMTRNSWRKIALWVLACALFVAIVGILVSLLYPADVKLVNMPDQSIRFKFAIITRGTNHVIFLGNPVMARLTWWGVKQPGLRSLYRWLPGKGDWFAAHTDVNKSVLWVGFEDPRRPFLHGSITNSNGYNVELPYVKSFQSSSSLRAIGAMQAFELPTTLDKLKGCTVRVYYVGYFEQEKVLATLQLQ